MRRLQQMSLLLPGLSGQRQGGAFPQVQEHAVRMHRRRPGAARFQKEQGPCGDVRLLRPLRHGLRPAPVHTRPAGRAARQEAGLGAVSLAHMDQPGRRALARPGHHRQGPGRHPGQGHGRLGQGHGQEGRHQALDQGPRLRHERRGPHRLPLCGLHRPARPPPNG